MVRGYSIKNLHSHTTYVLASRGQAREVRAGVGARTGARHYRSSRCIGFGSLFGGSDSLSFGRLHSAGSSGGGFRCGFLGGSSGLRGLVSLLPPLVELLGQPLDARLAALLANIIHRLSDHCSLEDVEVDVQPLQRLQRVVNLSNKENRTRETLTK